TAARSAAKQARRAHVPEITPLHDTAALVRHVADVTGAGGLVMVLHESADGSLPREAVAAAEAVTLIVGPEGGVDGAALAALTAAGARPVRLGPEVLRTSAAAAVALGALGVLTGRWDRSPLEYRS